MLQFNIFDQTKAAIEAGSLKEVIPAFYLQRRAIENNPWHTHDSVFNHVLNVFEALKKVVQLEGISEPGKSWLKHHLAEKVVHLSRAEITLWAGLLHDIAKPQTLMADENGITSTLDHENLGAQMAEKILSGLQSQFAIDPQEIAAIARIVRNHMLPHAYLDQDRNEVELKAQFEDLRQKAPQIFWPQIMLALADMQGSQLPQTLPEEFTYRADFYHRLLSQAHA